MTDDPPADGLEAALIRAAEDIVARLGGGGCDVCRVFSWDGERFVPVDMWLTTGTR